MTVGGIELPGHEISNCFANFFEKKVRDKVSSTKVDENELAIKIGNESQ